ncbi:MAG: peptidylprolyl isomerase, partial [Myxococcales bacterium]|nr:peptidylprolyl isomerase [Myxococcales bacterium]
MVQLSRSGWSLLLWFALWALSACGSSGSEPSKTQPASLGETAERPRTEDGHEIVMANPDKDPAAEEGPPEPPPRQLTPRPTAPDPHGGKFTLEEAVEGLPKDGTLVAEINTSLGTVFCDLHADRIPNTVAHFVGLARGKRAFWDPIAATWATRPLYDGTGFHRVIPGFMIQGGDQLGDGSGGVGFVIDDEMHPTLKHDRAGQLCMANSVPNTNGGEFFITDGAAPHLDAYNSFTIFGQCQPVDVVARIARVPQYGPPTNRPRTSVTIHHVRIRRVPGGAAKA